jgi:hypothetical protein
MKEKLLDQSRVHEVDNIASVASAENDPGKSGLAGHVTIPL